MSPATVPSATSPSVVAALLPLMAVVLIAFLVIGVAMPVLPLHVSEGLGFGPFMVGLVAGCQFAASLVARIWSGRTADAHGAQRAVLAGLAAAAVAGLLYLLSLRVAGMPRLSVAILLAGRAVLGGAESFIITGATTWGLARVGARNAGTAIAWMGTAMFAAFAGGAPLGTALYEWGGFAAVALATVLAPLATLLLIAPVHGDAPAHRGSTNILSVVRRIWMPGLGAALASIGFGAIVTFASLLFVAHGWTPVWLAFTSYAVALIAARLLFGHLPDRIGGGRGAALFVLVGTGGLAPLGVGAAPRKAAGRGRV